MGLLIIIVSALVVVQIFWLLEATKAEKAQLKDRLNKATSEMIDLLNEDYYCFDLHSETTIKAGERFALNLPETDSGMEVLELIPSSIHGQNPDSVFRELNFSVPVEVMIDMHFELLNEATGSVEELSKSQLSILKSYDRSILYKGRRWLDTVAFNEEFKKLQVELGTNCTISAKVIGNGAEIYLRNATDKNQIFIKKELYGKIPFLPALNVEFYASDHKPFYSLAAFRILLLSVLLLTGLFILTYSLNKTIKREKRLSNLKNELIANITHEFNTPVTNIGLALRNINPSNEKEQNAKEIIEEENKRISRNIEWVMAPNAIDDFVQNKHASSLDVQEVIELAAEHVQPMVKERNGSIVLNLRAKERNIIGDESQLLIAIDNVLDNAIKYSPKELKIEITTFNRGHKFYLEIADKGIGISNEGLEHIFDQFYRVNHDYKHDVQGFGIGLFFAKKVAKMHKGDLVVKSKLGFGSTFTFIFPIGHKQN